MNHSIETVNSSDYLEIVEVWEASVRATHHFLKEDDIIFFKPLILNTYLDAVELRCVRIDNRIIGFLGVADHHLEMLFIHPDYSGRGIGKRLLHFSIESLNVQKVDVNEQNDQAVDFYLHCGFQVVSRSELDATGKPYPILHLALKR
jgi:putative acetyltransferase